jgi:hypothetical protein
VKRVLRWVGLSLSLSSIPAFAQAAAVPPPATTTAAPAAPDATAGALPPGHPGVPQALPAGHPNVAPTPPEAPEEDAVIPSRDVQRGSIKVKLVDENGLPLVGHDVSLGVQFQKIAEGEKHTEEHAKTDQNGMARFSGLTSGSDFSYRVGARNGPATYTSDPVQLRPEQGVLVLLHVYPFASDPEKAAVGARGFVYVETRDDVFQFEVLYRYFTMGKVTWVPDGAKLKLPSGFKAFKPAESMSDGRVEEVPGYGARVVGSFPPGQHDISFQFQLPRHEESSASFHFGLPPRTAEIRFLAAVAPSMRIDVDGFEKPRADNGQNGQRMLVTRRLAKRGEPGVTEFTAELSGIPTPGSGRWIAVLIAAGFAALGFAAFRGLVGKETQQELHARDAERARDVLLDELVDLTQAHRDKRIGPSTYENARRVLVEALSRIVSQNPGLNRKKKSGTAAKKPPRTARA